MCKKGRAEGDTAGHLPFSPALPRFPPAQPSAQEPRPPPAPVPSHSVLVLGVGSRDTRPGRGAGEVATGPADGTPTPGVHQFAREPTGPRPRPLHSPPHPTRIALSGTGGTRARLFLLLRHLSAWATRGSTVLRPALLLQIPSCTAQPVGHQYSGTLTFLQIPTSTAPPRGQRNPCPTLLKEPRLRFCLDRGERVPLRCRAARALPLPAPVPVLAPGPAAPPAKGCGKATVLSDPRLLAPESRAQDARPPERPGERCVGFGREAWNL